MEKILTSREIQIMDVLWNSSSNLSASQIADQCEDMSVYSVQQVLQRLLKLGFIVVDDIGYSKKVLTRLYVPTVSQGEYICFLLGNDKNKILDLMSYIVSKETDVDILNKFDSLIQNKIHELN